MSKMNRSVIVAGMPRAGSTWLYYNLKNHPQVAMPDFKETFFFGSNFKRGFDWYYSLYDENIGDKVAFDVSPNYYCDDKFFENISQFNVDHKVILILREPAEWLVSLYSQLKSFTPNMPSLEEYLEEIRIDFDGGSYTINPGVFDFSGVVNKYTEIYKGRLLLINFDEIKNDPIRVLKEIETFSEIDGYFNEDTAYVKPVNVSIPKFNIIAYLSTKHLLRKIAVNILPQSIQNKLLDYIYKVNKPSNKDMDEVKRLEEKYKPVYVEKYFDSDNVKYL
jgi:hypothetical protein